MAEDKVMQDRKKTPKLRWDMEFTAPLLLFLFAIPLIYIVGNEGMGYFALARELFVVFSLLFGYGFSKAVAVLIRVRIAGKQYFNSRRVLITAALNSLLLSLIGAGVIYFGTNILLEKVYDMKLAGISCRCFGILLLINGLLGCLRGYFEGNGTKMPTTFSGIVEAFVSGTSAIFLAVLLNNYGSNVGKLLFNGQYKPALGAAGIVLGMVCGALLSLVFLLFVHRIYQRPFRELLKKDDTRFFERKASIMKELYYYLALFSLEAFCMVSYRLVNVTVFIRNNYMKSDSGPQTTVNTIQRVGSYFGKTTVLIAIIIIIILGMLLPNQRRIRKLVQKKDMPLASRYLLEDLRLIGLLGVVFALVYGVGAKYILQAVFQAAGVFETGMLQIAGLLIPFVVLAVYLFKLLKSAKMQKILYLIYGAAFVIQTVVMVLLVRVDSANHLAMVIAEVVFWLIAALAELILTLKVFQIR